jgi:hypothetical protein
MVLKLTNLILLLFSVVWLSRAPDWEPLIAFLSLLFGYSFQEYNDYKKLSSKDSTLKHDKDLFESYEKMLPENDFRYVLNNDLYGNWMHHDYSCQISRYLELATTIKGHFLNKKIQSDFKNFVKKLSELKSFMAKHFFVINDNSNSSPDEWILSLYPDLKNTGDEQKRILYFQRGKELHDIIDDIEKVYNTFRNTIKKTIHV